MAQSKGYCGLENPDSICYLNAVLQTLFRTKEFRKHVESVSSGDKFIEELKKLFKELEKQQRKAVSAAGVTEILDISDVHKEQDAAEYLQMILTKTPGSSELFKVSTTKRACVSCRDKHKQEPREDFLSLTVSFKNSQVVEDAVKAYVGQMCGVYQMNCHNCKKTTDWKCKVINFPNLLIIQLSRFEKVSYGYTKNDQEVIIRPQIEVSSLTYDLYAIVNHKVKPDRNGHQSGHYYVDIECGGGNWRRFDDETVLKTPGNEIPPCRSKFAYLLVYRR